MKQLLIFLLLIISFAGVSQQKPSTQKKGAKREVKSVSKDSTGKFVGLNADSALGKNDSLDMNTYYIYFNKLQLDLLQEVIAQSDASFQRTNALINIVRTQQFHPKVPGGKRDTTSKAADDYLNHPVIPKGPAIPEPDVKPKTDSTAGKSIPIKENH